MIDPRISAGPAVPPGGRAAAARRTTGRHVVVLADVPAGAAPAVDWGRAGFSDVADTRDFPSGGATAEAMREAQVVVFAHLGIAVVAGDPAQVSALQPDAAPGPRILSVSPELVHRVLPDRDAYTRGYRDGVDDLARRLLHPDGPGDGPDAPGFEDTPEATWGLQAVEAVSSPFTGRGVGVAVLDTGLDLAHPDFAGRTITARSFVPGEEVQDGHGHGTHCVGTACGPRSPESGPRYGVASEADVFVGKVLSDAGEGTDGSILAGIDWAVADRCAVISMSLGADVAQEHPPYSAAGRRALEQGSLVIAAAGNNAERESGRFGFVGAPANSPEIMAVGALDPRLETAYFSARSLPARGGQVDVAGPGVDVLSSWPMPERYRSISGTSMATPHVAGVAALWAEATGRRGLALWATLSQEGRRLLQPSVDVGSGLCLAPSEPGR